MHPRLIGVYLLLARDILELRVVLYWVLKSIRAYHLTFGSVVILTASASSRMVLLAVAAVSSIIM